MNDDQAERGPYQVLQSLDKRIKELEAIFLGPDRDNRFKDAEQAIVGMRQDIDILLGEGDVWG